MRPLMPRERNDAPSISRQGALSTMMEALSDRIVFRSHHVRQPAFVGEDELNQQAIEQILHLSCAKDTFEVLEDQRRALSAGVTWRRRRLAWVDKNSGEDQGLCVNEVRIRPDAEGRVHPHVAMASPGLVDFEAIENAYWQTTWASGAIRHQKGIKKSRLFVNMRALTCARMGAPRGPWEDLAVLQQRMDQGEWTDDLIDLIPALQPTLRHERMDELDVARYLPAIPPSWCVQADETILAATNGAFFLNFPEEYEDGVSALHQPVGALYADNVLHMPPWIERPCAVEWIDNVRRIELLGPQNLALAVDGAPAYHLQLGIVDDRAPATVWRRFDGPMPVCVEDDAADLVFSGAGLVTVAAPGAHQPPLGGAIVRLVGQIADPWRPLIDNPMGMPYPRWELRLQTSRDVPLDWVMAAGPRLIHDGHVLNESGIFQPLMSGEFRRNGPPPSRFPYDALKTRAPRTALGLTRGDEWVLLVVDGRADMAHSVGCTLEELARLMQMTGCYHAMGLDGGGSSVMAIEGVGQLDQLQPGLASTVVNIPSDPGNRERIVPVTLSVIAT